MKIENWHRRQALMLASQLPGNPPDALAVIECVTQLATVLLQADLAACARAKIVSLVPEMARLEKREAQPLSCGQLSGTDQLVSALACVGMRTSALFLWSPRRR